MNIDAGPLAGTCDSGYRRPAPATPLAGAQYGHEVQRLQAYIAIIGPSDAPAQVLASAQEAGSWVARAGAVLVTGGLGGAMEAACRGAQSAGGTTVGILPGDRRSDANRFVDIAIPTGMGEMRNLLVVRAADAVLAVGGGLGTLSELALALKLGKPTIGIGTWKARIGNRTAGIPSAGSPREAVERLLQSIPAGTPPMPKTPG